MSWQSVRYSLRRSRGQEKSWSALRIPQLLKMQILIILQVISNNLLERVSFCWFISPGKYGHALLLFFRCFWKKSLMLAKAAFIWSQNTIKTVILWNNIITIQNNFSILIYFKMYFCEGNFNFQQPLLQFSVSHDPSEIILKYWFCTQETIL